MKKRTLFPIPQVDQWAYDMYKQAYQSFWIADEVTFFDDKKMWPNLDKDEQHFIKHILAFFASSDALVNDNLAMRFYHEFDNDVIKAFYAIQIAIEQVHSQTYSEQIDSIIDMPSEKEHVFNAIETFPCIQQMSEYINSITHSTEPLNKRLIGMLAVEGIMFSSSFCAIYWLKKNSKMPGLANANELIARDEGLHAQFACELYKRKYVPRLDSTEVRFILGKVADLTKRFACDALPVSLIGMNKKSMSDYIEFITDYWSDKLGHPPIYNTSNPFNWMAMIGMDNKSNFFEHRVTEYSKAAPKTDTITMLNDF